ncbi:DUF6244 family protein [Micromonospora sp. WMMA1363]|uniref:DUF6244 family protein n=1 Tax=Micromonospora sp. WMMA1363 TaxID=3053985 RepID=UPI00259CA1A4|nr:DUF6244 family protein [Micromonospora sp. WMMA1363]MDM4721978.1 DUF6244 family protein [Micromonospora sp. WMMA1363]
MTTVDGHLTEPAAGVDDARRLVAAVLQGGQPGATLSRLQRVLQVVAAVRTRGAEAGQHVDPALAQARPVGDLGNRPRAVAAASADRPPCTTSPRPQPTRRPHPGDCPPG